MEAATEVEAAVEVEVAVAVAAVVATAAVTVEAVAATAATVDGKCRLDIEADLPSRPISSFLAASRSLLRSSTGTVGPIICLL